MNPKVLAWMFGRDTGSSSLAIVAAMEGLEAESAYPHDPSDLGRCIRLLDIAPEYRAKLHLMGQVSPQWAALVANWDELEAMYKEAEPTEKAPALYQRMLELTDPEAARRRTHWLSKMPVYPIDDDDDDDK